ncbi:MAG: NERD domain-containing protein [Burkholderiales bacterium]|nr:NERD domain-containing protein [Burkholderiales bacterium]
MAIFPQGLTNIDRRCDNAGERAVLHQLKRCLSDDYMVWHNVPIGPKARQPDFVILSPRRGLLIFEVKHWAWGSLLSFNRDSVVLQLEGGPKTVAHPLSQARGYAMELNNVLETDPVLRQDQDPFKGKSRVPYGWGCVLSNIRRKQVESIDFAEVFPDVRTLLRDDLAEDVDPEVFEELLWSMYAGWSSQALTLPQRDRVRWHLFPEVRVQQGALFNGKEGTQGAQLPDLLQVMDLQQEQIARTLGEGHRVIHGVAGSGKTMILVFRAQQLAAAARPDQPILVLCYNRTLAQRITTLLRERGVDENLVLCRTFHAWCQDMVRAYQLDVPQDQQGNDYWQALVHAVNRAVQTGLVPGGQYLALLIDEAHDFDETWLQMAVRMVNPASNSLLVLYDDAQSIYQKQRRKFSFSSVGIQAQGRTSVLKLNYRNTAEVLALAMQCAANLVAERPEPEDAIQTVQPATAGRRGPLPVLIEASNPAEEAELIAERVAKAVSEGKSPNDIAVLFRTRIRIDGVSLALQRKGIAIQAMRAQGATRFDWSKPSVKLITLHSAKGLEFPLVFIAGLDSMPWKDEPLEEEVRLLYVGMTRSTHSLVLTAAGNSPIVQRVKNSLEAVAQAFTPA